MLVPEKVSGVSLLYFRWGAQEEVGPRVCPMGCWGPLYTQLSWCTQRQSAFSFSLAGLWVQAGNTKRGSITVPLTFCLTGIESAVCQLTFFCFYLQNRRIQTSQTGGQWYRDTSPLVFPGTSNKTFLFVTQTLLAFYKPSYLNEEVNRTKPSPSVSVPCFTRYLLGFKGP